MENPFSLKGKTTGQTPNNFTIIKSITIILVYASLLKKKNLSYFSLFSHTKLSFSKAATLCSLLFIFFSMHNSLSWLSSFSKRLPLGCSLFPCAAILVATLTFALCATRPIHELVRVWFVPNSELI